MPPTTAVRRGDVVLVGFVFTDESDESGEKLRPAVVVSSAAYHRARREAVIAAITSNTRRRLVGDHLIVHWQDAGLLHPSLVTGVIRTIKKSMVRRRLGRLHADDQERVSAALAHSLGLALPDT